MTAEWSIPAEIRPKSATDRSDWAIERFSRAQHHVLTLAQLEEFGLSARAVRHRVVTGRLIRLHRGVYGLGRPTAEARWMAAVLVCGEGAVLSHRSAAELLGLIARRPGPVHLTTPTRTGRDQQKLRVHAGTVSERERSTNDGIPCTSVARTLLDLASSVDARTIARAIDQAELLQLFDLAALHDTLDRHPGERGTRVLRDALAAYAEPAITASEAEERLLELVRAAGLPEPKVNVPLVLAEGTTYRPDFLWPDTRLIVEVDGRTYHARRRSFEDDRVRDRRLALAGYETRRYAASELVGGSESVVREIASFLRLAQRRMVGNGRHTAASRHSLDDRDR